MSNTPTVAPYVIEVYEGRHALFSTQVHYWRMRAPNGRIVADGSEPYSTRGHALRAAKKIISTPIVIKEVEAGK